MPCRESSAHLNLASWESQHNVFISRVCQYHTHHFIHHFICICMMATADHSHSVCQSTCSTSVLPFAKQTLDNQSETRACYPQQILRRTRTHNITQRHQRQTISQAVLVALVRANAASISSDTWSR